MPPGQLQFSPGAGKQRRRIQSPQDLRGFGKAALAAANAQVNRATLPPDADLRAACMQFLSSLTWPGPQAFLPQFEKLAAERVPKSWNSAWATTSASHVR